MSFVTNFTGPEGRYELKFLDYNNISPIENVKLIKDVTIKYGDMDRSPARQILKSYVTLNFVDEYLNLHERIRGGFPLDRFEVRISGPDVEWRGTVKEETRTIPFNNSIRREVTQIRCFGGIEKGRFGDPTQNTLIVVNKGFKLRTQVARCTFGEGCGERLRSDIYLKRSNGDKSRVEDASDSFEHPLNLNIKNDVYEAFKDYAKMTKGMLYRSLSENHIVYDSIRLIGYDSDSSEVVGRPEFTPNNSPLSGNNAPPYGSKNRDSFFNFITQNELIIEDESGLKDLSKTASQNVEIETDENIIYTGAVDKSELSNSTLYWRRTDFSGSGLSLQTFWRKSKSKYVVVKVNQDGSGSPETFNLPLGDINPTRPIGIAVEWDANFTNNNPTIRLKYDGNTYENTDTNDSDDSLLVGAATTNAISPEIEVENGSTGKVAIKAKYIDENEQVIESLKAEQERSGTETIEYERPEPPLVNGSNNPLNQFEAQKIIHQPPGKSENFGFLQTYRFRARMETETRPFGTKTLRGKVKGIYGPEYCHILRESGSDDRHFVATGLECNLVKGTTKLSLVEVPNHRGTLPISGDPTTNPVNPPAEPVDP